MTIPQSVRPCFIFSKTFYTWTSMTIPQSHRPGLRSVRPWYGHWRLGSKMCLKKKWKNPICETVVWSMVDRVKNLIEKKWPRLSDSDMVTGGFIVSTPNSQRNSCSLHKNDWCSSFGKYQVLLCLLEINFLYDSILFSIIGINPSLN